MHVWALGLPRGMKEDAKKLLSLPLFLYSYSFFVPGSKINLAILATKTVMTAVHMIQIKHAARRSVTQNVHQKKSSARARTQAR